MGAVLSQGASHEPRIFSDVHAASERSPARVRRSPAWVRRSPPGYGMPPPPQKNNTAKILLIILAVVFGGGIFLVAILAAILFPVFAKAREKARLVSCESNVKQIELGLIQYLQDHNEKYPGLGLQSGEFSLMP